MAQHGHIVAGRIPHRCLRMGGTDRTRLRSEEHTSELQSLTNLVCRLLLDKKKSGEYADYFQLSTLTSAQMKLIIPKVINTGDTQAWDTTQTIKSAFYDLNVAKVSAFCRAR